MLSVNSFAKVWKIEAHEKYTQIQFSTSTKDKATGEYKTDYSGFARLIGKAHDKGADLNEGDQIKILNFGVTNNYVKAKNTTYTNVVIFDFENQNAPSTSTTDDGFLQVDDSLDSELPFA